MHLAFDSEYAGSLWYGDRTCIQTSSPPKTCGSSYLDAIVWIVIDSLLDSIERYGGNREREHDAEGIENVSESINYISQHAGTSQLAMR